MYKMVPEQDVVKTQEQVHPVARVVYLKEMCCEYLIFDTLKNRQSMVGGHYEADYAS